MSKSKTDVLNSPLTWLPVIALILMGCSDVPGVRASSAVFSSSSTGVEPAKVAMAIRDSAGALIYSDASVSTRASLNLRAGSPYTLSLTESNPNPGSTYSLQITQIDIVSGTNASIPLSLGNNNFSIASQGDYALKLKIQDSNSALMTVNYLASVSCSNPTLTASSLDPSQISVSESSGNLFTLSAAKVVATANGTPPYECAWDPTGTGIRDTGFADCNSPVAAFYSNFIGRRNVGLIVRDACNTLFNVSSESSLLSVEPSMPGNVFISGQTSNAAGNAVNDPRIDDVNYLATNAPGHSVVHPSYTKGQFQITASQNYGFNSSASFGVQIQVVGLVDSVNLPSMTGSVNAANASIAKITYMTDQAGDSSQARAFSSSSCTLSNQKASVTFVAGAPCASGETGDNNKAAIEVWAHYKCRSLVSAGASIDLEGDFDGQSNFADACIPKNISSSGTGSGSGAGSGGGSGTGSGPSSGSGSVPSGGQTPLEF